MAEKIANRRSVLNSFRIEEDFTNRQILRVVCAASLYVAFVTLLLCVFYTYVLNPTQIGKPSLLSFPADFRSQWHGSAALRGALQIWIIGMLGMTATFAIATGLVLIKKLAGPIHRLKSDLRRMRDGADVFAITLRDRDELQDVAEVLNETLVAIETRHGERCSGLESELRADERSSSLSAMRGHLASLPSDPASSGDLNAWATRMQDLIDKAESESAS